MSEYREELPPMPARIASLHVRRGYRVPWFVVWLDEEGQPVERGAGEPDFRVMGEEALLDAVRFNWCWICGEPLGRHRAFVAGPMCAINRTSAEPPSHVECADWSARACPFLTRPKMTRRDQHLPEGSEEPAGIMLQRNPGVAMVWVTSAPNQIRRFPEGLLFRMGEPDEVRWYTEGRPSTREEVEESIETGLPLLLEHVSSGVARAQLDRQTEQARWLLPL